jgi:hypothetical protein
MYTGRVKTGVLGTAQTFAQYRTTQKLVKSCLQISHNHFQPSKLEGHEYNHEEIIISDERASRVMCLYNSVEIPTRCNLVIEFIIPKFIEGSTYFERHTAHHQEL